MRSVSLGKRIDDGLRLIGDLMSDNRTRRALLDPMTEARYLLRRTPFGSIAVLWSIHEYQPHIFRVLLSRPELPADDAIRVLFRASRPGSCAEIDLITGQMEAFLVGEDISFPLDTVRLDLCSDFQQRVLRAEHAIPRGKISTYRLIARFVGQPAGARAIGTALATNPFPIIVPCHRTIRSDRMLGGYQGGQAMKRALLEMEGIHFDSMGRVATPDFCNWSGRLDAVAANLRRRVPQAHRGAGG